MRKRLQPKKALERREPKGVAEFRKNGGNPLHLPALHRLNNGCLDQGGRVTVESELLGPVAAMLRTPIA